MHSATGARTHNTTMVPCMAGWWEERGLGVRGGAPTQSATKTAIKDKQFVHFPGQGEGEGEGGTQRNSRFTNKVRSKLLFMAIAHTG